MTIAKKSIARAISIAIAIAPLGACVSRPSSSVLEPVTTVAKASPSVTVLAATNREQEGVGFNGSWSDKMTYEGYLLSVPLVRDKAAIIYPQSANPDPRRQFFVERRSQLSKGELLEAIAPHGFDGTAGIFVHGYNYSYQEALFRTAQVAADVQASSPPIMFSWPSAASATGYVADRDAALASRTELEHLVADVASSSRVKHVVLFGHSMGGFLVMEAARQLRSEGRSDVLNKLTIILAAPDIDVDVFRSQLAEIGVLKTPITLLVARNDRALQVSSLIARQRPRVGRVDIDDPRLQIIAKKENLRVVDITSVQSDDGLGHDRYAFVASYHRQLSEFETKDRIGGPETGAFVLDTAGAIITAPLKLAGELGGKIMP